MSDTHQWTIVISGADIIGEILPDSVFYSGPFTPGTMAKISSIHFKNAGAVGGLIYFKICAFPGTVDEEVLIEGDTELGAGVDTWREDNINIPNFPGTNWPLGVKVWGATEVEPDWGA